MKKIILSLAAAAIISGGAGTNTHAENVKVQDGDTLWGLSAKYEVSINDIKSWNNLTSDMIHPNDLLKVSREETYTIKNGDTLSHIAAMFGVTVQDLKEWNKLSSDLIQPDDQLSILTNQSADTTDSQPAAEPAKQAAVQEDAEEESQPEQPAKEEAPVQAEPVQAEPVQEENSSESDTANELSVRATAYTASCEGCTGITATGVDLNANPDAMVIAVDPTVIPLGSKVYVEGYGYATAADTGGAIKGNKIDLFFAEEEDAVNWGVKQVNVKVLK